MSSRPQKRHQKGNKPLNLQYSSPSHSSDSEGDLEQDHRRYQPTSPAEWSHHRQLDPLSFENGKANTKSLPPELLIHIFGQLERTSDLYSCLLVSASWCQCAVELLWLRPKMSTENALLSFLSIIRSNREAERNLVGTNTKVALDPHFPYASFVRRLNLSIGGYVLTDADFLVVSSCIRMERLTLTSCVRLTDSSLSVLSNMPNLTALDLAGVVNVTDKTILIVSSSSPKIQGINLGGCKKITDVGISAISSCSLLRRIRLCELDLISDSSVSILVKRCPLLIEIDLTGCIGMGDSAVRDIWTYSSQLRELKLASCTNVGDVAFPVPPQDPTPPVMAHSQPPPVSTFSGTQKPKEVPDDRLRTPVFLPPLILPRPLSHLRQLDLTGLMINDYTVAGIVANAPGLRYLVLAQCSTLTDNAVSSIADLGKSLQFLHLGHASAVTDVGIKDLARSCVRLRYVDLSNCRSLTNESVRALCTLPKLRRIGLVRIPNLTDEGAKHLIARYNTLERVHLSYCEKVTVKVILLLLQKLNKLVHLSLTGVPAFMKRDLQRFSRSPPSNFNENQRQSFCVYSGNGIRQLRDYLERVVPRSGDLPDVQSGDDSDFDLSNIHLRTKDEDSNREDYASESEDKSHEDPSRSPLSASTRSPNPPRSSSHFLPSLESGAQHPPSRAPAADSDPASWDLVDLSTLLETDADAAVKPPAPLPQRIPILPPKDVQILFGVSAEQIATSISPYELLEVPPSYVCGPLQPVMHRAQELVSVAPDLAFLGTQCIHLSRAFFHATVAFANEIRRDADITQEVMNVCLRLRMLGNRLQRLFNTIMDHPSESTPDFLSDWQIDLDEIFKSLSSERYGGQEIRQTESVLKRLRKYDWGHHDMPPPSPPQQDNEVQETRREILNSQGDELAPTVKEEDVKKDEELSPPPPKRKGKLRGRSNPNDAKGGAGGSVSLPKGPKQ